MESYKGMVSWNRNFLNIEKYWKYLKMQLFHWQIDFCIEKWLLYQKSQKILNFFVIDLRPTNEKSSKIETVQNSGQRDAPELSTPPLCRKFRRDPENRHEKVRNEKHNFEKKGAGWRGEGGEECDISSGVVDSKKSKFWQEIVDPNPKSRYFL